jgi:hypothetical protein
VEVRVPQTREAKGGTKAEPLPASEAAGSSGATRPSAPRAPGGAHRTPRLTPPLQPTPSKTRLQASSATKEGAQAAASSATSQRAAAGSRAAWGAGGGPISPPKRDAPGYGSQGQGWHFPSHAVKSDAALTAQPSSPPKAAPEPPLAPTSAGNADDVV